jgi:hypothetical protein
MRARTAAVGAADSAKSSDGSDRVSSSSDEELYVVPDMRIETPAWRTDARLHTQTTRQGYITAHSLTQRTEADSHGSSEDRATNHCAVPQQILRAYLRSAGWGTRANRPSAPVTNAAAGRSPTCERAKEHVARVRSDRGARPRRAVYR